jgi:exodeoxyribonuclease-5
LTLPLPLTPDQQDAAVAFSAWLDRPGDGTPFVLSGYAGSGKTFLSMRLLARADAAGLCWTVVAPTHKAVGVLRQHLQLAGLQPTWFPSTLHRLLRLKLRRERDQERCEVTAQTAAALEHLGLVLIDEASMIDAAVEAADRFYPAFDFLLAGAKSPDEAMAACMAARSKLVSSCRLPDI